MESECVPSPSLCPALASPCRPLQPTAGAAHLRPRLTSLLSTAQRKKTASFACRFASPSCRRAVRSRSDVFTMASEDATKRLSSKKQTLDDAYAAPANFLEIDVINPITHGIGNKRYTDYEVRMKTNLPVFRVKESSVRRRYSDFEWLRNELERDSKIVVPPLPSKAIKRQMPFRSDDGIYEESFIEERRSGLESFVNKIAGHPLAQNERCLHMFLQEPNIDRNYVPGKIRNT